MKSIFAAIAVVVTAATTYAGTPTPADGTVSVLKSEAAVATTTVATATPVVAATPVACEEARVVKLPQWQVRRLNRVADRQEAREARNCCKDSCACDKDCCKPKTLVLESRRKEKCDCCCK